MSQIHELTYHGKQPDMMEIPGLTYLGHVSYPVVCGGKPLPMFEPNPPKDRPSINTLEGWTACCREVNRKSFIYTFGREPVDDNEVSAWVESMCRKPHGEKVI